MRDTLGWVRSSLISHSPDVRCPVLWDPCIHPGDRSTDLGIRGSDTPALGSRGWVEEVCPMLQPWAVLLPVITSLEPINWSLAGCCHYTTEVPANDAACGVE